MKNIIILFVLFTALCLNATELKITNKCTVVFASKEKGQELISRNDEYTKLLQPIEIKLKTKDLNKSTIESYLQLAKDSVKDWEPWEEKTITNILKMKINRYKQITSAFPEIIYFIKSDGRIEDNACYTRGNTIVFSTKMIKQFTHLANIVHHEIFHVITRFNKGQRDLMYKQIGFNPCNEVQYHPEIAERRIANPDATTNSHYITLKSNGGKLINVIPVIFSKTSQIDVKYGMFSYLEIKFMEIEKTGGIWKAKDNNGKAVLYSLKDIPDLFNYVGRNTFYLIHPEETLADNFAFWVLDNYSNLPSPKIIENVGATLSR